MREEEEIDPGARNDPPPPSGPPPVPDSYARVESSHSATGYEGEFESFSPLPEPAIRISGPSVILENGAELPAVYCVKSGKPAVFVVNKALRDPRKPTTWFGGRQRIPVGLSKEHRENRMIANALTWSVLAVGVVLIASALPGLHVLTLGVGGLLVFVSGVFRATYPVWSPEIVEDHIEIRGTGEGYRRRLLEERLAVEAANS